MADEEITRQVTLEPGSSRIIDDLYNANGNRERVRFVASECPTGRDQSGSGSIAIQPVVGTHNQPPLRAAVVASLHEMHGAPSVGRVWLDSDLDEIVIQPSEGLRLPRPIPKVAVECTLQSAVLRMIGDTSDRFEVRLESHPGVTGGRALLVFLPDDPVG
jgi:hypothetical protein